MPTVSDKQCPECKSQYLSRRGVGINDGADYDAYCNSCDGKWDLGELEEPEEARTRDPHNGLAEKIAALGEDEKGDDPRAIGDAVDEWKSDTGA